MNNIQQNEEKPHPPRKHPSTPSSRAKNERKGGGDITRQGSAKGDFKELSSRITVRFTESEKSQIEEAAREAGYATAHRAGAASYVRELALGYQPKSNFDKQLILELAQLHAQLGKVGGLFKLAIAKHEMKALVEHSRGILELRDEIKALVSSLHSPRK